MLRIILAAGTAAVLCGSITIAQDARAAAQQRVVTRICTSDISARCAAVRGDRDRFRACIREHLGDLSKSCQASLARLAAIEKACAADVKQTCAAAKAGHGRVEACLMSALADLSAACQDALTQAAAGAP